MVKKSSAAGKALSALRWTDRLTAKQFDLVYAKLKARGWKDVQIAVELEVSPVSVLRWKKHEVNAPKSLRELLKMNPE